MASPTWSGRALVVREVADQDAAQVPLTEGEHVIQTLPPDRTDEAVREGIFAMGCGGREDMLDPQTLQAALKRLAVDLVAVVEELRMVRSRPGRRSRSAGRSRGTVGCSVTLKWTTRRR